MSRFEVTYDAKLPKIETYGAYGMRERQVATPGWRWVVFDADDAVVTNGFIYGGKTRQRQKAIKVARRIAQTHTYSEEVISRGDAQALQKRIEALERDVLT